MAEKKDFFKFPRTKHLFDAGGSGVSRDDLLMDSGEEAAFYSGGGSGKPKGKQKRKGTGVTVAIEEKVDGANLGISLDPDSLRLRVQNRSHFVDSKSHRQFSTIDSWLDQHSEGLYQILNSDPVGRYILFGEWLYAKHSILYTRLPDYFLAFDIYDAKEGKFLSLRERNKKLEGTGIYSVRLIAEDVLTGRNDVLKWMNSDSAFYDGPCEGIYLRIDEDSQQSYNPPSATLSATPTTAYCQRRGKLVRPDFMQGIEEQWTRQHFTKNIVQWT